MLPGRPSARAVLEQVELEFGQANVSLRTVQGIMKEYLLPDPSGPWRLSEADGEHVALILPVLQWLLFQPPAVRRAALTNAEAEWICRLRRAASDLPPCTLYRLTRLYMFREERGEGTEDIDGFLAFAPWRGGGSFARYREALHFRWVPVPPLREALAANLKELWKAMGYSVFLIDVAKNYLELARLEEELIIRGEVRPKEQEAEDARTPTKEGRQVVRRGRRRPRRDGAT